MADIDTQLDLIRNDIYGEVVRNAIADADSAISEDKGVKIRNEIQSIRGSRYGYEIRGAIIEALEKLNTGGGGGGGSKSVGPAAIVRIGGVAGGVVGALQTVEEE